MVVFGSFARGEADAESDIDTVFVRPLDVDDSDEAWADSVDEWRSRIRRISGNPVEVIEVDTDTIGTRLASRQSVLRDIRREGIVVHGRSFDELAEVRVG